MRAFKDMTGAVFDIPDSLAARVEDIFSHETEERRVDFVFGRAKELEMPAVAVTDHGTMTALYDAYKESQKTGVKLIPGMEAYFSTDLTEKKSNLLLCT